MTEAEADLLLATVDPLAGFGEKKRKVTKTKKTPSLDLNLV